jgi:hypothetical protein
MILERRLNCTVAVEKDRLGLMKNFSLQEMLTSAGQRMRADLAERMVEHPGELGTGREEIIRRFLRSYIPARFDVSTGFVFDSKGNVSKQLDIIIANALLCPRFETAGGNRFYPCESVVAVGQVKSSLTSDTALQSALENLESVKELDRSANGRLCCFVRSWTVLHFHCSPENMGPKATPGPTDALSMPSPIISGRDSLAAFA